MSDCDDVVVYPEAADVSVVVPDDVHASVAVCVMPGSSISQKEVYVLADEPVRTDYDIIWVDPSDTVTGVPGGISPGAVFMSLSDADLGRELDAYRTGPAGATWLRIDIDWSLVESVKGSYVWGNIDRVVDAAAERGYHVLGIIAYAPQWANGVDDSHTPPTNPADYAAFCGAAATHLIGRVQAYEVWNEPNINPFWHPAPNVAAYTALVKAAYPAIKAVDPQATVMAGAMSPAVDSGGDIAPVTFTNGIYSNGGKGFFDALSLHPYCFPAFPSDGSTADWNTFQKAPLIHQVMVTNGDGSKLLWLSEWGAPTGTGDGAVSDADQAAMMTDAFDLARSWVWAGPLFVYSGRDRGTDTTDREQCFGLIRADWSEKPSYDTYLAATPPLAVTAYARDAGGTLYRLGGGGGGTGEFLPLTGGTLTGDLILGNRSSILLSSGTDSTGTRWELHLQNDEAGDGSGSDLLISRYDDDGNYIDAPVGIRRDFGGVAFSQPVWLADPVPTEGNQAASKAYVDEQVAAGGGGGGAPVRTTESFTTISLEAGWSDAGTVDLGNGYRLYTISTSAPARVRLYTTIEKRGADDARPIGTDPVGDHGLILEFISSTAPSLLSADLSPLVDGFDGDANEQVPWAVTNVSGVTNTINVTFTYLRVEG